MPRYRLVFQDAEAIALNLPGGIEGTADIDSGDVYYEVGSVIEHGGRHWQVSKAAFEQPDRGEIATLVLWPAAG